MSSRDLDRLRGLAFLASALVALLFIVVLLVEPALFDTAHPVPLVALLLVMVFVSIWQASGLLR